MRLTNVDGLVIIPAVAWVVAHRLVPSTILSATFDRHPAVVTIVVAIVVHLLEGVGAGRHSILGSELNVPPCTFQRRLVATFWFLAFLVFQWSQ